MEGLGDLLGRERGRSHQHISPLPEAYSLVFVDFLVVVIFEGTCWV